MPATFTGSLFFMRPNSGAEWVMRMHSGITPHEEREMREWLLRSERNNTDLLRAETVWRLSGALLADPEIKAELLSLRAPVTPVARQPLWRAFSGRRVLVAAGLLAIAGIAGIVLLPFAGSDSYVTAPGDQRQVRLEDGSAIALNTDTRVEVRYTRGARSVTLERGEALFQVEHDPHRPFIVKANEGYVRAVGTRFNVFIHEGSVTVAVLAGSVELALRPEPGATRMTYIKGETAAYQLGHLIVPDEVNASQERILGWREGKLSFEAWPLKRALDEHNRYAIKPVRLAEPEFQHRPVSAILRIGDTAALVGAICQLMSLQAIDKGHEVVLVRDPSRPAH